MLPPCQGWEVTSSSHRRTTILAGGVISNVVAWRWYPKSSDTRPGRETPSSKSDVDPAHCWLIWQLAFPIVASWAVMSSMR